MAKRRNFDRLIIPVPLTIRFLGVIKHSRPIIAETRNVSLEGLSIELEVSLRDGSLLITQGEETIKLIPFLVLNEKLVGLDIKIPPKGETIKATGRIRWYDFGSRDKLYYFRAGIFLKEMEIEDRKKWKDFIKNVSSSKR